MSVDQSARVISIMRATPGCLSRMEEAGLDEGALTQVLDAAQRVADQELAPLGAHADAQGCALRDGRVHTPEGYGAAYRTMGEEGWLCADLDPDLGGMGLPLSVHVAASMAFEGAAAPFMMQAGSSRSGAHLLAEAAPEVAAVWAPRLAAGDWTATICISEPDAGSDVGRLRTRATQTPEGWKIDGTKCWISFGDNDFATRIGHLALARTGPPEAGTRGLSLFLVADRHEDGTPNGVVIERLEEKLGLHGSPTCVMRFEDSLGTLIGLEGRGLPTLFGMIERMRLQVACQGAGTALVARDIAQAYAQERCQGGAPDAPPVPIARHPDVARMLAGLDGRAGVLMAMMFEVAATLETAQDGDTDATERAALLLPLAKTFGGELAFEAASEAIQVLGGAGYTREWPLERLLRDARILTIYEGTTGMQAQDFVFRRLLRDSGAGLGRLLDHARAELAPDAPALPVFAGLASVLRRLAEMPHADQQHHADLVLRAGWAAVSAWMACRLLDVSGQEIGARDTLARAAEQMLVACHRLGCPAVIVPS